MQFNIHVPKGKEAIIAALDAEAQASGTAKNQIVLEALAAYLGRHRRRRGTPLRTWDLGATGTLDRADLYRERVEGGREGLD